jgi:hypothetical protein
MTRTALCIALLIFCAAVARSSAADLCRSGLPPGQRPGPYAAVVSVGSERGQSHCFICAAEDRPIVIVFARTLSEPLGKLVQQIDRALPQYKGVELRGWVTFLHEDQASLDAKVVAWAQKYAVRNVPIAVFEDVGGPPSYRLALEADVTILLSVRQRVAANFAFRAGELNDAAIAEVLKALPRITATK